MTTATLTLTEFLLARIAEDEEAARRGISGQADPENGWGLAQYQGVAGLTLTPHVGHIHERVQGEHIIRWHPARVLAECEAKRRIVERHRGFGFDEEWAPEGYCGECEGTLSSPCATLRLLALPYADHPDYREEWRP